MKLIHTVIITYQRKAELQRALKCLEAAAANCKEFEYATTVLINGRDPETEVLLLNYPNVKLLKSEIRHTPAGARLEILKTISACDWLYFSDDDAFVPDEFFLNFSNLCHLNFDVFGGPNLTPTSAGEFEKISGEVLGNKWITGPISYRYSLKPELANCDERHLILCNLFLKFLSLDKFNLPGQWPGGEENKAIMQLISNGGKCFYSPKLFVYHDRRPDLKSFSEQMFKYGMGRGLNLNLFQSVVFLFLMPFAFILRLALVIFKYMPFKKLQISVSLLCSYLLGIIHGHKLHLKNRV